MTRPPARPYEQRFIDAAPGFRLWADATGDRDATALLLIMGANASGLAWPDALVARLAERHRVLRYDHRDTGRSTRAFAERPYPILDLAADALAVLDGFGVDGAHVVGMSLGGMLAQLLLLDAPERVRSATVFSTGALEIDPPEAGAAEPPGPSHEILAMWQQLGEPRDRAAEVAFNVEHWRLLSGAERGGEFEESEFRAARGAHPRPRGARRSDRRAHAGGCLQPRPGSGARASADADADHRGAAGPGVPAATRGAPRVADPRRTGRHHSADGARAALGGAPRARRRDPGPHGGGRTRMSLLTSSNGDCRRSCCSASQAGVIGE